MNGLNSNDDAVECPLCMEPLEVDDLTFFPCTCGYQICRFCWHRIRTDENKLCPACRKEYPENPADFKPLTQEEMIAFKSQKRQRDQQRKQKITENRKHLANVRVVQKNLVFVVGLPPRLADADILKKHEYFGKYGKIHKVVINPSTTYAGVQGPSASAYVTYVHNSDALRAIQSVNNIMIDGRLIKTSLGTTKYCSHFMKNQQCPKGDCMYLHELGDPEASFTKEEMHQGKHQEYEKRLHDTLIASSGPNTAGIINGNGAASKANGAIPSSSSASSSSSSSASGSGGGSAGANNTNGGGANNAQQKEAWPSLSVSPINGREAAVTNSNSSSKSKREKLRNEKRHEKNKSKNKNSGNGNSNASNKENNVPETRGSTSTETFAEAATAEAPPPATKAETTHSSSNNRSRKDRAKEQKKSKDTGPAPKQTERVEPRVESVATQKKQPEATDDSCEDSLPQKRLPALAASPAAANVERSLSSCSENSEGHVSTESSVSEKSDFPEEKCNSVNSESQPESVLIPEEEEADNSKEASIESEPNVSSGSTPVASETISSSSPTVAPNSSSQETGGSLPEEPAEESLDLDENGSRVTDALSKLNIFDDAPSFFSSSSFQQAPLIKNKLDLEMRQSHLPDLVNDIDGIQKASNANEWEEAFKNVMLRNTRHVEEQLLQQQHLQQQQQHHHQQVLHQQEEFLRMHELQKRNNFANNLSQINGPANDFLSHFQGNSLDLNRAQAHALLQQQLLQQQQHQQAGDNLFGGNMSKFFDFHKTQQQSSAHHPYLNGHNTPQMNGNEPQRVAAFMENNRLNSSLFVENGLINSQQQPQKQRLMGMFENLPPNSQSQQNRFTQPNSIVDDDLGFDPFIETQKGLAELMENEVVQQQSINTENAAGPKLPLQQPQVAPPLHQHQHHQMVDNMQRARMPPPGFNHVNTLGLAGGPSRLQQHTSKMMPFMNMAQQGQHQMPMAANWNHLAAMHQNPGQSVGGGDSQLPHPMAHNKVYNNSDWTTMDPAILSFRQFSSFPQNQIPPHPQQQQDMFLQHLAQQQQQNSQSFNNQPQQQQLAMPNNMAAMANTLLNGQSQQPPQQQVNANVQGMLEFLKSRQFV
ncbi:putative uncharacterized protein DDB_G0271606 isoform X2 [Drosophila serrata]|uniref:putative uncharacterized protein DDB_G0271606 isoform X2 n=1 Tax=Drosophila serrata TaxID=7274 RepID=UPI000A1D0D26|nr:putative uncharacterized protein DDB_G0271606 isoform X2 [Drosophila serrata]